MLISTEQIRAEDSTGSLWFTQSTENQNEERLFGALDKAIP